MILQGGADPGSLYPTSNSLGIPPHPGTLHVPVASQEAQAGGADFVVEDDHGEDVAFLGWGILHPQHPPLHKIATARAPALLFQQQLHVQVALHIIWRG